MGRKTDTQKLQEIADEKFGKNEITVVFERFVGFYAQFEQGSTFLGNSLEAECKLKNRDLR